LGDSNSGRLREVLWCLLASLAIELLGAFVLRSYMLWENVLSGAIDILFLLVNMWGLFQEDRDNPVAGWRIAFWSDAAFAAVFAAYTLAAVTYMFKSSIGDPVSGAGVLLVAILATAMNLLCTFKCPKEVTNGKSARLKLAMGVIAGGTTAFDGLLTLIFGYLWFDIFSSVLCGVGVVLYISYDLRKRWLERAEVSRLDRIYQLN
jgi:hypothetical protein